MKSTGLGCHLLPYSILCGHSTLCDARCLAIPAIRISCWLPFCILASFLVLALAAPTGDPAFGPVLILISLRATDRNYL